MDAAPGMPASDAADADAMARSLAQQFRILNILWIIVTVIQIVSCAGVICAAWNVYVLVQRWKVPRLIEKRDPAVLRLYQNDLGWFITFAALNFVLGGVIGVGLIGWEFFFIRAKVLQNKHIFARRAERAAY